MGSALYSSVCRWGYGILFLWVVFQMAPGDAFGDCTVALAEADRYYQNGNFERVIELLTPCLQSSESSGAERVEAYRLLAMTYLVTDRFDNARAAINELLDLKPNFETTLRDPRQFVDMVERVKNGRVNIRVALASGVEESIFDAPAAMVVVTAEEIRQRGYTDLPELIMDLPGFDVTLANGTSYIFAYQRGYRTPFTQRTLLMFNNQVDNDLWSHEAVISRQYPVSNIKRVEVLYGPASAIYGPNAFLGIINVITNDGSGVQNSDNQSKITMMIGDYNTNSIDIATRGNVEGVTYAGSVRVFRSDEPDFSQGFGFLRPELFAKKSVWGPILDQEQHNVPFGTYADPSDDNGFMGSVAYKGVKVGFLKWARREAYGPYYAADHVQNNAFWSKFGSHIYLEVEKKIAQKVKSKSVLVRRSSRAQGNWVEAFPDWNPGKADSSFVSFTQWHQINNSWLFKQNFEVSFDKLLLMGGLKFERKELTKSYDIPGYYHAFSSSVSSNEPGPWGQGAGVGHSRDISYTVPPPPNPEMPPNNLALTEDKGGFMQAILDADPFRFSGGIRFDTNSIYGSAINPRVSAIYKFSKRGALKLWYGEAFQEPPPLLLWGGFSGRAANEDLEPEKARNTELILMLQNNHVFSDFSLYFSRYDNVIKEEGENAGTRDIWGAEYKLRLTLPNFISDASDMTGYVNYTYTNAKSSIRFNHQSGVWEDGETDLGDIAPHKIGAGVNLPVSAGLNVNLRGNFVSRRKPYSRNALRGLGLELGRYYVLHGTVNYTYYGVTITLKALNMTDNQFFHPGGEQADSGIDFTNRSRGFRNSLIPQPGRTLMVKVALGL